MSAPAQRHDAIEDSYALSSMQQGMVFHHLYASHSGVDTEPEIRCGFEPTETSSSSAARTIR